MKAKRIANPDKKKILSTFEDYLINNEIDRNKLLKALNDSEMICDGEGNKITLSIAELSHALADIDKGVETNYKILRRQDLGTTMDEYSVPKTTTKGTPLSDSQILIYDSLLVLFQIEFKDSHPELKARMQRYNELVRLGFNNDEMRILQSEVKNLTTKATTFFGEELHKTNAKIHQNFFTKTQDFLIKPSFAKDISIGVGVGLFLVIAVTVVILGFVGTSGIGPLVFGAAAAATLGPVGIGFSLSAIAAGIVGLFAATSAVVSKYFRPENTDIREKKTVIKDVDSVEFKNKFTGITGENPAPISSQKTENSPEPINHKPVLQPTPSKKFERMYKKLSKDWDVQSTIFIGHLNNLEGKIKNNFKDFRLMRFPLLKELQKDFFSTDNFNKNFVRFDNFINANPEYKTYQDVIKIYETYGNLVAIRNEYHANKPELDKLHECKVAEQDARATLENARRDFRDWLRTASDVSIQRIQELYPEKKDQEAMCKMCSRLGVRVFDSINAEERQSVLADHRATKEAEYAQAAFRS